jgi:ribose 5-phosphate isomerase B
MSEDQRTRDRVRALVREVLDKAMPADANDAARSQPMTSTVDKLQPASATATTFVDIAPDDSSGDERPISRDESSKMVITEDDMRGLEEGARLRVAKGAHFTPLAADLVREKKIELVHRVPRRGPRDSKLVAIGSDHGGYKMKEELKSLLSELGHRAHDFGTSSEEAVDYPDFAHAVARAVAEKQADVGIIIDGAGVGSAITANKVPGVRAAACYSVAVAQNSREHNDANVLSLGSKTVSAAEMREIVRAWLATEISEERHRKRVAKIVAIERQYSCKG